MVTFLPVSILKDFFRVDQFDSLLSLKQIRYTAEEEGYPENKESIRKEI